MDLEDRLIETIQTIGMSIKTWQQTYLSNIKFSDFIIQIQKKEPLSCDVKESIIEFLCDYE